MKQRILATAFLLVPLSCARGFPDWYYHQDRTIKMPRFDGTTKIDGVVDGPTLQALRAVEDDFLPPPSKRYPCAYTPAALVYKVIRRGDVIFVEVDRNPEACGGHALLMDGGGRYAVSLDGRILRRQLDLEPGDEVPDDGGGWTLLPTNPDGGGFQRDLEPLCPPSPYLPPEWNAQLKCPEEPDAGLDAGTSIERDGGTRSRQDAASPDGGPGRQ